MPDTLHMTDTAPAAYGGAGLSMPCSATVTGVPFARIVLGDRAFQVCDRTDADHALAFRPEAGGDWMCLSHTIEDGWLRIGADILQSDPATLMHFLTTHAVRQSGWFRAGDEIVFDTLGTPWSVRLLADGRAEVTLETATPRMADPSAAQSDDLREQAIEMLIAAYPDLSTRFAAEIDHWAVRLAHGALVTPIL